MPGEGPQGAVRASGDRRDTFKASLQAGQVIEIDFAADPRIIDIDLFVVDAGGLIVGRSTGPECLRMRLRDAFRGLFHLGAPVR
ncbi:MAG: hypothetical protein R3E68_00780 [Burkholderiaceae bacterium]